MAVAVLYPHIEKREGQPACLARLPRIRVAQIVMDYVHKGWSPMTMVEHYPHLRLAEIHSSLAYYYDHQGEIDKEIEEELAEIEAIEKKGHHSSGFKKLQSQGRI